MRATCYKSRGLPPDMEKLPAHLRPPRRRVSVDTAGSQRSADIGHYYAHPGNRFWRTVHEIGITPRRYQPHEFAGLLNLGIGFTDMCKVGAGMDHIALQSPVDVPACREKMRRHRQRPIAFSGRKAASLFYGRAENTLVLGQQPTEPDFPAVFVLTSPSGAASGHWSLQPW